MKTFATDFKTNDLYLDGTHSIATRSDIDAVLNVVENSLRTLMGEIQLNTTLGIPYFETILQIQSPDVAVWEGYMIQEAEKVDGVIRVNSMRSKIENNILTYEMEILTKYGTGTISNYAGESKVELISGHTVGDFIQVAPTPTPTEPTEPEPEGVGVAVLRSANGSALPLLQSFDGTLESMSDYEQEINPWQLVYLSLPIAPQTRVNVYADQQLTEIIGQYAIIYNNVGLYTYNENGNKFAAGRFYTNEAPEGVDRTIIVREIS